MTVSISNTYAGKPGWLYVVNALTTTRLCSGIAFGVLPFFDVPLVGEVYFIVWISVVLMTDCEGYLARITGSTTKYGAAYDQVADGVLFAGIGIAVMESRWWAIDDVTLPIICLMLYAALIGLMRCHGLAPTKPSLPAKCNVVLVALATLAWLCHQTFGLSPEVEHDAIELLRAAVYLSCVTFYLYVRGIHV